MWTIQIVFKTSSSNLTPDLNLIIKNLLGHILIIILPADLWVLSLSGCSLVCVFILATVLV